MSGIFRRHSDLYTKKYVNALCVMVWWIAPESVVKYVLIRNEINAFSVWSKTISICFLSNERGFFVVDIMYLVEWSHRLQELYLISSIIEPFLPVFLKIPRLRKLFSRWILISNEKLQLYMLSNICLVPWKYPDSQNDYLMLVLSNMLMRLRFFLLFRGEDSVRWVGFIPRIKTLEKKLAFPSIFATLPLHTDL